MFGDRKCLRRLAAHTLLLWCVALGWSIVHACIVGPDLPAMPHGSAGESAHVQHVAGLDHAHRPHAAAGVQQIDAPPVIDPACAKFCSDKSVSVAVYKPPFDALGAVWLAPPPAPPMAVSSAQEPAGVCHAAHGLWREPVPIPISFLRLTL